MQKTPSSRRSQLADLKQENFAEPPEENDIILKINAGVHAGLWLDKYIVAPAKNDTGTGSDLVEQVASIPMPAIYKKQYARWKEYVTEESVTGGLGAIGREFAVKSGRMAVGLGNESVLETSVVLHRTYGVPYIPGSALKGLAASYARLLAGPEWSPSIEHGAYSIVFGTTEGAGYVNFLDALYVPVEMREGASPQAAVQAEYPLHTDVITVHHPDYYQGKAGAPPADWDSPTPIAFLSATGTYLVAIAAPDLDSENCKLWLNKVFELLEEALLVLGIGAKTSSGYGRMELLGRPVRSGDSDSEKTEEARKLASLPYIRPNIPKFTPGQGIVGHVIAPTDELRQQAPEARAFLCYREFSAKVVLITVNEEEAASWTPGQTKNCLFVSEEERNRCTMIICLPGVNKEKKK